MILGDHASKLQTFVWISNHVLVHIRPKSMELGEMTNLNVIFHIGGSVYRLVTIQNSPQFPDEFRNGLFEMLIFICLQALKLVTYQMTWRYCMQSRSEKTHG